MTGPRRRPALLALVIGIAALGGCTDPSAFASPSAAAAAANPTPRRTQALPSRPESTPPTPTAAPSAGVATPLPHSDLEALLPSFSADGQSMSIRTATIEDFADGQTAQFIDPVLAALGRPRSAIEMAVANGSWMTFTAVRVDGAMVDDVEDAVVGSLFANQPGTETPGNIGGRPVRWLKFADDGPFPVDDIRVFSEGDVVFLIAASNDHAAVALETAESMFEPKLVEVLPAALDGRPLERFGAPGAAFNGGGDVCSLVCPAEVPNLAKALGVDVADIDLAFAYRQEPPGLAVIAFRIPGQSSEQLVTGRIESTGRADEPQVVPTKASIGGKTVTWVNYSLFDNEYEREYLYAHDGILFSIRPAPADGVSVTPFVEAAIRALP